jgi:DNA-binding NarL/FixJ family response regulator
MVEPVDTVDLVDLHGKTAAIIGSGGLVQLQVRQALQRVSVEVVVLASTADRGVDCVRTVEPDRVLLDEGITRAAEGTPVIQEILDAHAAFIVVMFCEGNTDIEELRRAGAAGFVEKPFDATRLIGALRRAVENYWAR